MDEPGVLRAVTFISPPYIMRKPSSNQSLAGNDRYEGYMIDLLYEIVKIVHFNFTIFEASDSVYGGKDHNGEWNGMVGEIIRKNADFSAIPMGISEERNEALRFTVTFLHPGLGILYKRPEQKDPGFLTVLTPLSVEVWLSILAAFVVVGATFMIQSRISPDERPSSNGNSEVEQHKFNLWNSFWFTAGALMQQGTNIEPRALSTRMLAGVWWFFSIIIISSYTANLAAFLTVERMNVPIESVEDLAQQTKIKYGVLENSFAATFFKESRILTYQKMWNFMQTSRPSVFVKTEKEGIQRVKQEDFAFITITSMIEYYVERDCNLMQIGSPLTSMGLGMAFRNDSQYVQPVTAAILRLQDRGVLDELKYKWWKLNGGGQCQEKSTDKSDPNPLGLPSVSGAFIILLFGLTICLTVSVLERACKVISKNSTK